MKKIIPFEKEIIFKTNVSEITSIALENTLSISNSLVSGEFIVSGDYKVTDASTTVESFNQTLPVEIHIDDKYNTSKAMVDIDDFYYEVINNSILKVCIDVSIDKLEEKENIEMDRNMKEVTDVVSEKIQDIGETIEENTDDIKEVVEETKEMVKDKINSLFSNMNNSDTYISYNVYIIRDGDTLDTILEKYETDEDTLKLYNDLSDLQIGDKIIIPS